MRLRRYWHQSADRVRTLGRCSTPFWTICCGFSGKLIHSSIMALSASRLSIGVEMLQLGNCPTALLHTARQFSTPCRQTRRRSDIGGNWPVEVSVIHCHFLRQLGRVDFCGIDFDELFLGVRNLLHRRCWFGGVLPIATWAAPRPCDFSMPSPTGEVRVIRRSASPRMGHGSPDGTARPPAEPQCVTAMKRSAARMHPAATMQPSAKRKTPEQNQASAFPRTTSLAGPPLIALC